MPVNGPLLEDVRGELGGYHNKAAPLGVVQKFGRQLPWVDRLDRFFVTDWSLGAAGLYCAVSIRVTCPLLIAVKSPRSVRHEQ